MLWFSNTGLWRGAGVVGLFSGYTVSRWLHSLGLSHPCTNIGVSAVLVAVSFSVCVGFKSLKDSRAAFVSNPFLLVILRSERHSVQAVFGQINARSG